MGFEYGKCFNVLHVSIYSYLVWRSAERLGKTRRRWIGNLLEDLLGNLLDYPISLMRKPIGLSLSVRHPSHQTPYVRPPLNLLHRGPLSVPGPPPRLPLYKGPFTP